MVKKLWYQTAAVAALGCVVAGNATAQENNTFMGDVAVSFGSANYGGDNLGTETPEDTVFFAIEGYLGVAFSPMIEGGLSFSARGDQEDSSNTGTDEVGAVMQAALHLGYAVSDTASIGAFVSTGEANVVNGASNEGGENFGISGEFTNNFATFYGKLASFDGDGIDAEAMNEANWVQFGMLKELAGGDIGGSIVFGSGDNRQNEDIDFRGITVAYGRPIGDSGASWFAAVDWFEIENGPENESLDETAIRIGLQFTFNKPGTSIPSHKTIPTLPVLAAGYTSDIVD